MLNVQGLEALYVGQIAANNEKTLVVDFQDPDARIRWCVVSLSASPIRFSFSVSAMALTLGDSPSWFACSLRFTSVPVALVAPLLSSCESLQARANPGCSVNDDVPARFPVLGVQRSDRCGDQGRAYGD